MATKAAKTAAAKPARKPRRSRAKPAVQVISGPTLKRGRPRKLNFDDETLDKIEALGQMFCTVDDCARFLKVGRSTFLEFMANHPEAREALDDGLGSACVSLRRKQFKLADKHPAMAIFLGKNYLDQRDRQQTELTGADGSPLIPDTQTVFMIHDNGRDG